MNEELNEIVDPMTEELATPTSLTMSETEEGESAVSQTMMVNHDLTTLFLIARTVLPYEFLYTILYGKFEDVAEDDIEQAKEIIANHTAKSVGIEAAEGQWGEEEQLELPFDGPSTNE